MATSSGNHLNPLLLSNLGLLDEKQMMFGSLQIRQAFELGPVMLEHGLMLTASTYRERMTLAMGYCRNNLPKNVIEQMVNSVQEVLLTDKPYWEKMTEFIRFISEMMAQGKTPAMDITAFTSSKDLLKDPDLKKVRESAEEKMLGMLFSLVQEGKKEGQIRADLSEDAFRLYFMAFMKIFSSQQFRQGYYRNPQLIQDVSSLMIYGLSGEKR